MSTGPQDPYGNPPSSGDSTPPSGGGYGAPPPPPGGGYGGPPPPPNYGAGGYGGPGGAPPPNHLVWAILTTIFCCLPLGVPAIVFSAQVNSKWAAGDAQGAQESSDKAKKFAIWSAIAGVVVTLGYIALVAGGVMAGIDTSSSSF